jgi:uncharacterized protein
MQATYHFHGDLLRLLRRRWRVGNPIMQPVIRAASIKDVIESFGLPHTEVHALTCNGRQIDFSWPVRMNQHFEIFPVPTPWNLTSPTLLRPAPLNGLKFIVDINVGRLARYLRMAGFDTLYHPSWMNREILQALEREQRILLSRNLDLLKRKQVVFGRAIRANTSSGQLREVFDLFGIDSPPHPLSRCLECNTLLDPVSKADILHRLEPLTIRFFDTFHLCRHCDKIYWAGSHVDRMRQGLIS